MYTLLFQRIRVITVKTLLSYLNISHKRPFSPPTLPLKKLRIRTWWRKEVGKESLVEGKSDGERYEAMWSWRGKWMVMDRARNKSRPRLCESEDGGEEEKSWIRTNTMTFKCPFRVKKKNNKPLNERIVKKIEFDSNK